MSKTEVEEPAQGGLRRLLRTLLGAPQPKTAAALDPPDPSEDPVFALRRNYAAVGLSALLSFASFHPFDFGFLAYVALVPLLVVPAP